MLVLLPLRRPVTAEVGRWLAGMVEEQVRTPGTRTAGVEAADGRGRWDSGARTQLKQLERVALRRTAGHWLPAELKQPGERVNTVNHAQRMNLWCQFKLR